MASHDLLLVDGHRVSNVTSLDVRESHRRSHSMARSTTVRSTTSRNGGGILVRCVLLFDRVGRGLRLLYPHRYHNVRAAAGASPLLLVPPSFSVDIATTARHFFIFSIFFYNSTVLDRLGRLFVAAPDLCDQSVWLPLGTMEDPVHRIGTGTSDATLARRHHSHRGPVSVVHDATSGIPSTQDRSSTQSRRDRTRHLDERAATLPPRSYHLAVDTRLVGDLA